MLELSVIIPTFNRSQLLSYTLYSLVSQSAKKDLFEVIVADDGSTDDTEAVTRKLKQQLNIKYIYQQDRGYRPASARNLGITAAQGKICLFIDSGVLLEKNCIHAHVRFHQQYARAAAIGYVYGFEEDNNNHANLEKSIDYLDIEGSIKRLAGNHAYGDVREAHYRKYRDQIQDLPAPWLYFWTCHVSALRQDLMKVNLFDARYDGRWGVEDNDLGFRLCQDGVKIGLLREAMSIHYPHEKSKHDRHRQGLQNCMIFHKKFNTLGTRIFLDNFLDKSFYDINKDLLEISMKDRPLDEPKNDMGASESNCRESFESA